MKLTSSISSSTKYWTNIVVWVGGNRFFLHMDPDANINSYPYQMPNTFSDTDMSRYFIYLQYNFSTNIHD